jgi:NAD(P)H-flavin reductase
MIPWQFITFILPKIWWRAYSILKLKWKEITLIIKKRELDEWGRWWSKYICEKDIWDTLNWVGPAWHFLLKENNKNKLFIWTWTGFVPLYNMFVAALEKKLACKIFFTFWVRTRNDIFYLEELKKLKNTYKNFDFAIYISREKDILDFELEHIDTRIYSGYTTNYLTPYNIKDCEEIYICWAPAMIESTQKKLEKIWFSKENTFFEKY